MTSGARKLSVLTLLGLCSALVSASGAWKTFESKKAGYRVQYPASWYLIDPRVEVLNILNFPPTERVQGVVIRAGGAEISATNAPPGTRTLDGWIHDNLMGATADETLEVPVSKPERGGCSNIKRVSWSTDVGGTSPAYIVQTVYYCSTVYGFYSVGVMNWRDDPNQNEFREVALRIAQSLRAMPSAASRVR